jgi:hypothetical protein
MARLPGVRNNHPDQLRHLNLASLAPTAMRHANLRTTMLPRFERVVQHPQIAALMYAVRQGRRARLTVQPGSLEVEAAVVALAWPAALPACVMVSAWVRICGMPTTGWA